MNELISSEWVARLLAGPARVNFPPSIEPLSAYWGQ